MNRVKYGTLIVAATVAAGTCLGGVLPASAADKPAEWAPKDSAIYVGISNCDDLVASLKKTTRWKALGDPALADVFQPWKKFGTRLKELVAARLGLESLKQLEVYPHGGLALFVTSSPPTAEDDEPQDHLGLVMNLGEDVEGAKRLARAVVEKSLGAAGRKETKEAAGAEITTIRFERRESVEEESDESDLDGVYAEGPGFDSPDDLPPDIRKLLEDLPGDEVLKWWIGELLLELEPPEEFAFAFVGSKLVLASDTDTVLRTVKRLKKGSDGSFAGTAASRSLAQRCAWQAPVHMVLNLPVLVELSSRSDPEEAKIMRALGAHALGPFVMTCEVAPEAGVEVRLRGFLEVKGKRTGLAKLMMMPNIRTAPPPTVGADAAVYGLVNVNPAEVLAEAIEIVSRINPEQSERMRADLRVLQEDGSVLDVQKDVVDHLTGPLFGMMTLAQPYDADHVNAMLALGHKSRAAVEKLTAMLPPGVLLPREMKGSTIYESPMLPVQGLAGAVTDRVLALATKGAIEFYIRAQGRHGGGLADNPEFKRVARLLPKQSCAVLYSNGRAVFDAQVAIHKAGDLPDQPPMFAPAGTWLRWLLLQMFESEGVADVQALGKYTTLNMFTLASESDGLRMDSVALASDSTE